MDPAIWIQDNYIEIFGAVTGIIYVFLEIRQNMWLWPVGIVTSAVYIWVFFMNKIYADMSLQIYYLVISILGWIWWKGNEGRSKDDGYHEKKKLRVSHVRLRTAIMLLIVFLVLYCIMFQVLSRLTDSPVPEWDSFITSLSVVATWMLARKIYEHWYLWIAVNTVSATLFFTRELYPTMILYIIYGLLSFSGLVAWRKGMLREKAEAQCE